ncbi:MAG TPA: NAD(P)H-dependent oxidoreductase subunit E [Solirubrobacteraceae bacterium]|jgi:formate dehydrogenase/NADH-quinone oxidoreductase subunit F|nr:NAD(P)H-dependent oxidoreductase subunit E [Solirubrobacteraceae bacterium]
MAIVNGRVPGREARAGRFSGPSLIPSLNVIQREHGWLPREELVRLGRETKRPLYEIEGLISFYPHFRAEPPARVEVTVCRDLSCWLHGADEQIAAIRGRFGDDVEVEVREVSCVGRCDIAPAATVQEQPVRTAELPAAVERTRTTGRPPAARAADRRIWPNDPYGDAPPDARYATVRDMIARELSGESAIETLKESGLRGMGGAGFPTGAKWEIVAGQSSEPKFVICNADESEPGTFKDRQILAEQPHLVIEGMLAGMLAVGAEQGWVFIRHEYGIEEAAIRAELDAARAAGVMGADVLGSGRRLDIDVFTSPGGYILGEESALIECMEGHRGEPRNKPPFPGVHGLWGKPTLMNSVETFAAVPIILQRGGRWWKDQGVNGGIGLKFFAISGHITRPDVYCVPMGTTARELIQLAGGIPDGIELQAFQPGGASSNFLGPDQLDVPLDFKPLADAGSMLGSGAVVVIGDQTNLLAAATNVLRFFRNESCGKCVPCRVGSHKAHTILIEALERGGDADGIGDRIDGLEETLRLTSICGLGQVALGPVLSVLRRQRSSAPS